MRTCCSTSNWKEKTIEGAISVLRLIRIMKLGAEVELRSPARKCPECKGETEVLVMPEGLCGECWSRRAIAAWRVKPGSYMRRSRRRGRGENGKWKIENGARVNAWTAGRVDHRGHERKSKA